MFWISSSTGTAVVISAALFLRNSLNFIEGITEDTSVLGFGFHSYPNSCVRKFSNFSRDFLS